MQVPKCPKLLSEKQANLKQQLYTFFFLTSFFYQILYFWHGKQSISQKWELWDTVFFTTTLLNFISETDLKVVSLKKNGYITGMQIIELDAAFWIQVNKKLLT